MQLLQSQLSRALSTLNCLIFQLLEQLEPGLLGVKLKPLKERLGQLMEKHGLTSQDVAKRNGIGLAITGECRWQWLVCCQGFVCPVWNFHRIPSDACPLKGAAPAGKGARFLLRRARRGKLHYQSSSQRRIMRQGF